MAILDNRVAIVTGAGSGIGLAGAKAMAREGAHVVVADLSPERSEAAAEEIRAEGFRAEASPTDVSDAAALALFVERTIASHGRLDILLSHAGIQVEGTLEAVDPAGMDASWRLIVRAHFMAARLAMPRMRAQGAGSIIVTSSNSGVFYVHEMVACTTSKPAVNAMVRQVAVDYGRHGVRINALCPGWVDTPFNEPFIRQMGGAGRSRPASATRSRSAAGRAPRRSSALLIPSSVMPVAPRIARCAAKLRRRATVSYPARSASRASYCPGVQMTVIPALLPRAATMSSTWVTTVSDRWSRASRRAMWSVVAPPPISRTSFAAMLAETVATIASRSLVIIRIRSATEGSVWKRRTAPP
jgi:NAD(P)-dependent dehydrogenase (short-subunit alcohol dehydrogenase family)